MKQYIGKFREIKSLPADEQIKLLEKARYVVFRKQGKSGRWVALFLLSLLICFTLAVAPLFFFGHSQIVQGISFLAGISLMLTIYNIFYKRLIQQGLESVLAEPNA